MPFFLIFVIIPLIEIGLFITVGEELGVATTLLLCLLTAIIGSFLIRYQGLRTIMTTQEALREARMPLAEVFDGMCLLLAGALLLIPGFFTDFLGFSLLVPQVRTALRQFMKRLWLPAEYEEFYKSGMADPSDEYGTYKVIEGEYERVDPKRQEDA